MLSDSLRSAHEKDQVHESLGEPFDQKLNLFLYALISGFAKTQIQRTRVGYTVLCEYPGIVFPRLHSRICLLRASAPEKTTLFKFSPQCAVAQGVSCYPVFSEHRQPA